MTMSECPVCGEGKIEEGRTIKGIYLYRCTACDAVRISCDAETFQPFRKRAQENPRKVPKLLKTSEPKSKKRYEVITYTTRNRGFGGDVREREVEGRHLTENFAAQSPERGFPQNNSWNVTHKPTGLKATSVGSLRAARYFAQAFEKLHPCPASTDADKVGWEMPAELLDYLKWVRGLSKKDLVCFETWRKKHGD